MTEGRMPCTYAIDRERRLVISTGSGRVTFAEIKEHTQRLIADSEFEQGFDQLIDFTAVSDLDVSMDEAKAVARHPHFSTQSKRAYVASTPHMFAMGRLMASHDEIARGPEHTGVFYDLDAALQWLGLESLPEAIRTADPKRKDGVASPVNGPIA